MYLFLLKKFSLDTVPKWINYGFFVSKINKNQFISESVSELGLDLLMLIFPMSSVIESTGSASWCFRKKMFFGFWKLLKFAWTCHACIRKTFPILEMISFGAICWELFWSSSFVVLSRFFEFARLVESSRINESFNK